MVDADVTVMALVVKVVGSVVILLVVSFGSSSEGWKTLPPGWSKYYCKA